MSDDSKKEGSSFEDLEVFKRADRVSLELHRRRLRVPDREQHALADQIRRASKSICANLAEGFSRQGRSPADLSSLHRDSDWVRGRDAGLAAVLSGFGLSG